MARGLPVIVTDVEGNPELVAPGQTGLLVPVDDEAALAKAITLHDYPARCRRMGSTTREAVRQHFDWHVTVERYLAVHDGLLTAGSRQPA